MGLDLYWWIIIGTIFIGVAFVAIANITHSLRVAKRCALILFGIGLGILGLVIHKYFSVGAAVFVLAMVLIAKQLTALTEERHVRKGGF